MAGTMSLAQAPHPVSYLGRSLLRRKELRKLLPLLRVNRSSCLCAPSPAVAAAGLGARVGARGRAGARRWAGPPRLAARHAAHPRKRETDVEVKLIIVL